MSLTVEALTSLTNELMSAATAVLHDIKPDGVICVLPDDIVYHDGGDGGIKVLQAVLQRCLSDVPIVRIVARSAAIVCVSDVICRHHHHVQADHGASTLVVHIGGRSMSFTVYDSNNDDNIVLNKRKITKYGDGDAPVWCGCRVDDVIADLCSTEYYRMCKVHFNGNARAMRRVWVVVVVHIHGIDT